LVTIMRNPPFDALLLAGGVNRCSGYRRLHTKPAGRILPSRCNEMREENTSHDSAHWKHLS
jgi:hypothetical protein